MQTSTEDQPRDRRSGFSGGHVTNNETIVAENDRSLSTKWDDGDAR